jgi:hypothetical protein
MSSWTEVSRVAWLLVPLVLVGCGRPLSQNECLDLLDRYTDKIIDQARPSAGQGERIQLVREARKKASLDPQFAECPSRVSRSAFECAMAAANADQMERCLL